MFEEPMSKESKIHAISLPQPVGVHIHFTFLKRKRQGPGKPWGTHHPTLLMVGRNERLTEAQRIQRLRFAAWQCILRDKKFWDLVLMPGNFCALCIYKLDETQQPWELQIEPKTSPFEKRVRLPSPSAGNSIPWKFQINKCKTYLKQISSPVLRPTLVFDFSWKKQTSQALMLDKKCCYLSHCKHLWNMKEHSNQLITSTEKRHSFLV